MSSLPATCLLLLALVLVVRHGRQLTLAAPQQPDDAGEGPIGAGHPDGEPVHAGHQEMGTRVSKSPFERQQVSGALPLEGQLLQWMRDTFAKGPEHGHIRSMLDVQESYDFGPELTTLQLLDKAHFKWETFNSTSEDGYITQLVRIVNPYVKQTRPIPVVFYGGQGVSPGVFLAASLDKNHAHEMDHDWTYEASNSSRSLAVTLANNGYQVWLVGARGCDRANRDRIRPKDVASQHSKLHQLQPSASGGPPSGPGLHMLKGVYEHLSKLGGGGDDYWSFSADEIANLELRHQLELVMRVSGQPRLSLVSYSNGALISFAFMAKELQFAHTYIDTHISIGPAVYVNKYNVALTAAGLASYLSPPGWPFPEDQLNYLARGGFLKICKSKVVRYTACKALLDTLYGHSGAFQSQLELSLFRYMGRPMSPRGMAQIVQTAFSGHLRCYDHGPIGNLVVYNHLTPPDYKLESIGATRTDILLVSGERDAIADEYSVNKLSRQVCGGGGDDEDHQKRVQHIVVPGYNHLDLLAGWDVAEQVNRKVLAYLHDRDMATSYENVASGEPNRQDETPETNGGDADAAGDNFNDGGQQEPPAGQPEAQFEPARPPSAEYAPGARGIATDKPVLPPPSLTGVPKAVKSASIARPKEQVKQEQAKVKPVQGQARNLMPPVDRSA